MSFVPPRCPNQACANHLQPTGRFFARRGFFSPRCRVDAVPRFRCKTCGRSFSRQTFRCDYRDRRPEVNDRVLRLLISGVGLRQTGRLVDLSVRAVQRKLVKFGRTLGHLHDNLSRELPKNRTFLLDEEETFEAKSIRPLTMPVLIEAESWLVVSTAVGSIRRLAAPGSRRRALQDDDERLHGVRPDQSRECVMRVLQDLRRRVPEGRIVLRTDEKSSYATLAKEVFGDRVVHEQTSSRRARDTSNPLFAINTTMAMTRDNCGRLRRRSWLVTKKAERLQAQLHLFAAYRNYVRQRFNRDEPKVGSATHLGLVPRRLTFREVLAWRQDWGNTSPSPLSTSGARTVTAVNA